MSVKISRLLGIVYTLLQYDRVTAPELAEKFEVSRRTISRDIETLMLAGIPIYTQQGVGGGISVVQGFKLDKSMLNSEELSSLTSALRGLEGVSGEAEIEGILDKLGIGAADGSGLLPKSLWIDLLPFGEDELGLKVEQIRAAISKRKLIEFEYHYDKGVSHRSIEPYMVMYQWGAWYVYGYCLLRVDWRLFKILRILELNTLEQKFEPRDIEASDYLRSDYDDKFTYPGDDFVSDEAIEVVALFKHSERFKLVESYGPRSFHETPEGLLFSFDFDDDEYALEWLLSFGDRVKVIGPDSFVKELKSRLIKTLKQYQQT